MTLVPRDSLRVESDLAPAAIIAALPLQAAEWNRRAVLFGRMRCELDQERVRIGWWPWFAPWWVGIIFDGRISAAAGRTVLAGDVRFWPRWCEAYFAVLLLLAFVIPILNAGTLSMRLFAGVWLSGGVRIMVGALFRAYRSRIQGVLRAAAGLG